jgi:spore maturation protein CgeB
VRILFLGAIGEGQTSRMRLRALRRLGHEVEGVDTYERWRRAPWLPRQIQRRLGRGSIVEEMNREVVQRAREFRPGLVWAEKQEYLRAETLEELNRLGARLVHYTPDPYFHLSWKRTPIMDEALERFDVLLYCKIYERAAYEALGKPLIYLPLGFCDEVHRPLASDDPKWRCDVGFLGGWEPRREHLLRVIAEMDIGLKIWGAYWEFLQDGRPSLRRRMILRQLAGHERYHIRRDELLGPALQGAEVYGDDYARALSGARIGIGFLRKAWPDQHTTRTFEIPACGSLLLADRTEEHQELFKEGVEAEFFSSEPELVDKARYYARNEVARLRVAEAGRRRCVEGRYAYVHRIADALKSLGELS